jgi:hypothetical protein
VTKDTKKYENVAVSGILLPESLDYEKQKLYFMYSPEYSRTGQKVSSSKLETLGLNGFGRIPTAYYSLKGDVQAERTLGIYTKAIEGPEKVLRTLETTKNGKSVSYVVGSQNKRGNIRVNSFFPPYTRQNVMRRILREDLEYFKWAKRDCPQVNGVKNIVAVAFKEPRTAVIDFGEDVSYDKVKIVVFNGKDGVTRNEILSYERGMKIELPALNVLVAKGEDSGFWDFFLNIF